MTYQELLDAFNNSHKDSNICYHLDYSTPNEVDLVEDGLGYTIVSFENDDPDGVNIADSYLTVDLLEKIVEVTKTPVKDRLFYSDLKEELSNNVYNTLSSYNAIHSNKVSGKSLRKLLEIIGSEY